MKRRRHVIAFIAAALIPITLTANAQVTAHSIEAVAAKVKPAVVQIHVVSVGYDGGREVKSVAAGSGVIISKRGDIVTNHHVAGHAIRIFCILADKEEIEAELLGTDALSDIAVIRLKSDGKREFPLAGWGDSARVHVGDTVLAIGSPMALSQSVTVGVISNPEMVMPWLFWNYRFSLDGEDVGSIVRWIGHDAAIYGGNSGGALVNMRGEVIGINEISFGLGGAVPANLARRVAEQIIATGKVTRSWIGLEVQPQLKSMAGQTGVLISGTVSGSPADKAGIQAGDLLVKIAGKPVTVRYAEQMPLFNQMLADIPVGKEVETVVRRDGKEQVIRLTTTERQPFRPKQEELKAWGMTARNISLLAAKELQRDSHDGVLISTVRRGGPCDEAKPNLRDGDVIVKINGKPVHNVAELKDVTSEITRDKTEPVPVLVEFDRRTQKFLSVVKVGIANIEDPGLEISKAWLPIATQVITRPLASQLGIGDKTGVRVTQVYTNSTAEKAGLKVGDLIFKLDGQSIPAANPEDEEVFANKIRQYKIGATAELTVWRDNQELKIPVELVRTARLEREMKRYKDENFEFTARELTFFDKVERQFPEDQAGVLIEGVTPGGWAALGRLGGDDLLLAVGNDKITDVASLQKTMTEVEAQRPKFVVLQVLRGIHQLRVELEADWSGNKPAP